MVVTLSRLAQLEYYAVLPRSRLYINQTTRRNIPHDHNLILFTYSGH
jgi:hypothetical protein